MMDTTDLLANSARTLGYVDAVADLCEVLRRANISRDARADILAKMQANFAEYKGKFPS